mmetsp:Transcript_12040/g.33600  ORF Transcript_12040/g.33600 Transcript_12040/m.33600 type:complete len:361 (-) Transcript_12040:111-1193(-)
MSVRELSAVTAFTLAVACAVQFGSTTFAVGRGYGQQVGATQAGRGDVAQPGPPEISAAQPAAPLGSQGLLGFGVAFGVAFAAMTRTVTRVSRRAEGKEIEVAEKGGAITGPAYLEGIPRSLVDKPTLDRILAVTPVEEWDDPSEESPLYVIKLLSETYGPGKATKMRFSDFAYIKNQCLPADAGEVEDPFVTEEDFQLMMSGKLPLQIPGPAGWWDAGFTINFQGPERFSGDQIQTAVRDSAFSQQFLDNLAFYRQGLKPWQRGLEIGMAHGYFIIGPFVSLGPLRNTPEAATVGMLSGIAVIIIASCGGLLLGTTLKPTLFDKPGDKPAAGFQEMMIWHILGGTGGAAFAHILLTLFAL